MQTKSEQLQIEIADKIRGLSNQRELSKVSGVHWNTIGRVVAGENISLHSLSAIERGLNEITLSKCGAPVGNPIKKIAEDNGLTENELRVRITRNDLRRSRDGYDRLERYGAAELAVNQLLGERN